MDIVDAQIHFGPGHISETLAAMDALGVASALIDEAWLSDTPMPYYRVACSGISRPTAPTAELASLMHPSRFAYLIRVNRHDPELESVLRLAGSRPQVRALRITPGAVDTELKAFAEGEFDTLLAAALDSGISTIFVSVPGNAPALKHALVKFPAMSFFIDHCGMPYPPAFKAGLERIGVFTSYPPMGDSSDDDGKAAELEKLLELADSHPNVGLKWAHAPALFGVSEYPYSGLLPYLRRSLDSFGAERMMWASDASANTTGETWAELLYCIRSNPDLSESERTALLGGTARKYLNWAIT